MDRRVSFPKSRIDKIIDLATLTVNTTSQGYVKVDSDKTEVNTHEYGTGSNVTEPIEESYSEKHIECPVTTFEVQQSPVSVQTNENASKYLPEDLSISDGDFGSSSSDDYICDTNESSSSTDIDRTPIKRRRIAKIARVPETPSPTHQRVNSNALENAPECSFWKRNGMNSNGKKKKTRKSMKERREERVKRKLFRNTGLEYATKSGKIKSSRKLRDLENCRQKCKERLPLQLRKNLFETYWSLGSYEKRTEYIAKCIEVCQKKSFKSSPKKKRKVSFRYTIHSSDHKKHPICKGCFLKTFDESHKYVQTVCEKLRDNGGHLPPRKRKVGKSIPDSKVEEIKAHIVCFPCTESHYGRNKTTKKFLNSELNLQVLYNLYKLKTDTPVSKTIFKKVFDAMNLSFKKPSLDTCSTCDRINMKLKYALEDEAENLRNTLGKHQEAFKAAYEEKKKDKELALSCEGMVFSEWYNLTCSF